MMPLNHILRKWTAGYKLSKSQEKINHLIYMDDIKLFAKNETELETPIRAVRIYCQSIGMEFGIKILRHASNESGKRHLTNGIELQIKKKLERSEKRKPTWESWKLTPSNKGRWKKKLRNDILEELESYAR